MFPTRFLTPSAQYERRQSYISPVLLSGGVLNFMYTIYVDGLNFLHFSFDFGFVVFVLIS